jgi:general secretion pathway protein A
METMYSHFFGFRERPFQLVPNPEYLFMARSHEEALAHLSYAVRQGEGFVEITGEVGTGKTTLCRAFLETMDDNIEAAYIFNPRLDAIQLLRAITDEFELAAEANSIKSLIDSLNRFLMERASEGKYVVLLIDEAQNLGRDVLEQLRLLSNLETTKKKLLQIILVGQPELADLLDSYDLRQLRQRITLSCHLWPLTSRETKGYIEHRVHVASRKPGVVFTRLAFRRIHKYSRGVPRLINIVCDRALVTAYSLGKKSVTGKIVAVATGELSQRRKAVYPAPWKNRFALLLAVSLPVILGGAIYIGIHRPEFSPEIASSVIPEAISVRIVPPQVPISLDPEISSAMPGFSESENRQEPLILSVEDPKPEVLKSKPDSINTMRSSRERALKAALDLWNGRSNINSSLESIGSDLEFFKLAAEQNGVSLNRIQCDLGLLKRLNVPAILEVVFSGEDVPRYLTLSMIGNDRAFLRADDEVMEVGIDELNLFWNGVAYVTWKDFSGYPSMMPVNATKASVVALKLHLREIGFQKIEINPIYDQETEDAVREIQRRNGIDIDGVVGPLTKISLYNQKEYLQIPHIVIGN